ncbi:MAG: polyprenol monophosphomannose synthase [Propionibacteriaceae bacterium]|jgi:glycosyltransferase involved in cell wall biosynthesis|nr:polyprenol monophosphomannose synthase [Propionibacteriaceae bacterium]
MVYSYASLGRILVVLPTYNEAQNLEGIVLRIRQAAPEADILIADDNSPDHTGELADALGIRDSQVYVLHRDSKEGLGKAYIAGFKWGLERRYDVFVETDADGSHQPEELPMLLAALTKADMVKGSRWMRGGRVVNWPLKRELLSRAANIWVMAAMNIPIHDATGGYNLFRADMLRKIDLLSIESRGYSFQVDMTRRVLEAGGTVAEVPIEFCERLAGESKMSNDIIKEALIKTAGWGLARRTRQIRGWLGRAGGN